MHSLQTQTKTSELPPLTDQQREWVRANTGLVDVHLRHILPSAPGIRRRRDRDDLFQEGCLGLIRAAAKFDPTRGIPFAAWALPRIRYAISRAARSMFEVIYVPPYRTMRSKSPKNVDQEFVAPRMEPVHDNIPEQRGDVAMEFDSSPRLAIRDRIAQIYHESLQTAVREAGPALGDTQGSSGTARESAAMSEGEAGGGDLRLDPTTRAVAANRYAIPNESDRTPLRRIAEESSTGFGAVAHRDRTVRRRLMELLRGDDEIAALRDLARRSPEGIATPLAADWPQRCAEFHREALAVRLREADDDQRAILADRVRRICAKQWDEALSAFMMELPNEQQSRILRAAARGKKKRNPVDPTSLRRSGREGVSTRQHRR